MKSVFVASDLHMYCHRSDWSERLPEVYRAAQTADLFVFNGDTFDFKWTDLGSLEETVEAAIGFLRALAAENPECKFHVNLGNHDHQHDFMDALERLADQTPNITWHPYYLRVGTSLFLHGDVAVRKMSQDMLERYRARWGHARRQGRIKKRMYDAAVSTRAHVAISRILFQRRLTARRVCAYLEDIGHSRRDGVEQVYFGHTHVPLDGYRYRGLTFHNGGAPLKGMRFEVLKATV